MFAAVELGVFDGKRPADCKELARLLDACVALGLLEKRGDEYVEHGGRGEIPALGQPRYADRLHPLLQQRAVSDVGTSGGRGARRNASLEADLRTGRPDLLALLPHRRIDARVPARHAWLRAAEFARGGVGVRSERISPAGGSGRRQRASGASGAGTLSATSKPWCSICRPSRARFPERSPAISSPTRCPRPISTASAGFCTTGPRRRFACCSRKSTRRCPLAAAC